MLAGPGTGNPDHGSISFVCCYWASAAQENHKITSRGRDQDAVDTTVYEYKYEGPKSDRPVVLDRDRATGGGPCGFLDRE